MMKLRAFQKLSNFISSKRRFSSSNSDNTVTLYSKGLRWFHLIQAFGFIGCTVSGYFATKIDWKTATKEQQQTKSTLMNLHKSFGVIMLGALTPRLYFRFASKVPAHLPGFFLEKLAAKTSHFLLYTAIFWMPFSGVMMGYFSGYGVPFFQWKFIQGADKKQAESSLYKTLSSYLYWGHVNYGKVLEYLIPLHIGAVGFHQLIKRQNILRRINPFSK
jgi:cytochrome b561